MALAIGRYNFDGIFSSTGSLQERSGIYAIVDEWDSKYHVIDVGESSSVKTRVENHDRKDCWKRNAKGKLRVVALYTPYLQQTGRRAIEQEIRLYYRPICGER